MTMMNRRSLLAAGCAAAALSCAPAALLAAAPAYQVIRPEEARRMMERGGVVVLDVRTPEEFATGHQGRRQRARRCDPPGHAPAVLAQSRHARPHLLPHGPQGRNMRARRLAASGYRHVYNFLGVTQCNCGSSAKSCGRFASYYKCGGAHRVLPFLRYDFGVFTNREGKPPCTHAF